MSNILDMKGKQADGTRRAVMTLVFEIPGNFADDKVGTFLMAAVTASVAVQNMFLAMHIRITKESVPDIMEDVGAKEGSA